MIPEQEFRHEADRFRDAVERLRREVRSFRFVLGVSFGMGMAVIVILAFELALLGLESALGALP